MIDVLYGRFGMACDFCGEACEDTFDSFQEAVDFGRTNGWRADKYSGEWQNQCPECLILEEAQNG